MTHAKVATECDGVKITRHRRKVLDMLIQGMSNLEIAEALGVTETSIATCLGLIYKAKGWKMKRGHSGPQRIKLAIWWVQQEAYIVERGEILKNIKAEGDAALKKIKAKENAIRILKRERDSALRRIEQLEGYQGDHGGLQRKAESTIRRFWDLNKKES